MLLLCSIVQGVIMVVSSVKEFDAYRQRVEGALVHFAAADKDGRWRMAMYIEDCLDEMADPRIWDLEVDSELFPELVERYTITTIPTLLVLINGEEAARFIRKPWKKRIIEVFRSGMGPIDVQALMRSIEKEWAAVSIPVNQNKPD